MSTIKQRLANVNSTELYNLLRKKQHNETKIGKKIRVVLNINYLIVEVERKGILMICMYKHNTNKLTIQFATDWTDDELISGDDEFIFDVSATEELYFQRSLVEDFHGFSYNDISPVLTLITELKIEYDKEQHERS